VRESDIWKRAQAAGRRLVEIPFALPGLELEVVREQDVDRKPVGPTGKRQLDLFGGGGPVPEPEQAPADVPPEFLVSDSGTELLPTVVEGVIDLAFKERGGWVIADYKTDVGTDADFATRAVGYRRQVELYARAWTTLTGEPVKERVLFYTAQNRVESW
jgi:ATP-dependent helicase/nuclease subunit A